MKNTLLFKPQIAATIWVVLSIIVPHIIWGFAPFQNHLHLVFPWCWFIILGGFLTHYITKKIIDKREEVRRESELI